MKRFVFALLVLISVITFLLGANSFVLSAEENDDSFAAVPIPQEGLEDNIATADDVKWYSFTVEKDAEVLLCIKSLQKNWTGYTYYWYAAVYASDRETLLAKDAVRGAYYTTYIELNELTAGTYYLKITSVAHNNPLMAGFTDEKYQLTANVFYHDTVVSYDKKGVQTMSGKGQLICKFGNKFFIKLNEGEAYVALYRNQNNNIVPILISEDKEAVAYMISDGTVAEAETFRKYYKGTEYYCAGADYVEDIPDPDANHPIFATTRYQNTAVGVFDEVMEQLEVEAAGGEFKYFLKNYWGWLLFFGGVILIIVCVVVKEKISERNYKKSSHSISYSGNYGGESYKTPTEQDLRDMEDMEIAKGISERINTPGYDPEAPGPDPESFPTSVD